MTRLAFDVFSALDGPCLNGMEGEAGILRQRFYSNGEQLAWDEPAVKYFPGAAGGHAVQIAPQGDLGFLGGWLDVGVIFDPRTLKKVADYSAVNFLDGPRDVDFRSPTHMVFPKNGRAWTPGFAQRSAITACGDYFWEVDLEDPRRVQPLAKHGLGLPHALKLSATGRYIFCGAADFEPGKRARRVGIFEPLTRKMQVVHLQRTSWHIQTHPTQDIMYAVTENYQHGEDSNDYTRWSGNEVSIPVEANYIWKITPQDKGRPLVHSYALSMDRPSNLSSDIVVVGDEAETVLYNSCASATITMVQLGRDEFPRYIEEAVWLISGPHQAMRFPGVLRSAGRNLKEARWHGELFSKDGKLLRRARFVTRNSLVDGSYGLMLSPDNRWLISAHRGGNWFLVYSYPEVLSQGHKALAYRVKLPSAQKCLPGHACGMFGGALKDPRLGLHHCVLTTATVAQGI